MNYRMIAYSVGRILVAVAATMLAPLGLSLLYGESIALAYVIPIVISVLIGLCVSAKAPKNKSLYGRDGMFIVAIGWIVISIIGCLPFYISGQIPSFVDSFFETVSGFTTTGSSILTNVEALDKSLLFWRSFTHWLGGMGVLAFAMAIFSSKDTRTTHMMRAEMPGPVVGKIASRWQFSLRILYGIYIALTVIEFVLLLFGGMPVFDSLLHTFGTAGTGGFGIKNSSVAYYNSAYIDYVIGIFMMLFGLNFNVYFLMIARKFSQIKSNDEVKWYIGMMIGATVIIALNIMPMYHGFGRAFRYSFFQVSSIMTTTGYSTADFVRWPMLSQIILVLLMVVGACAGSTSGGMKVTRFIILMKTATHSIKKAVSPRSIFSVKVDGKTVEKNIVNGVCEKLEKAIYNVVAPLEIDMYITKEPVSYENRLTGEHKKGVIGESWGELWDCGWFNFKGEVPKSYEGEKIVLLIDISGEAFVVDKNGNPMRGLTTLNSEFDLSLGMPGKREVPMFERAEGGEVIDIWADCACNDLFGKYRDNGIIKDAYIATCNEEVKALYYDVEVLHELMNQLPEDSARYHTILNALHEASKVLSIKTGMSGCDFLKDGVVTQQEVTILNEEEVKKAKTMSKQYKYVGYEGTGSLTMNKVSSLMISKMAENLKKGKATVCQLVIQLDDPDAKGVETVTLYDVTFDSLDLANWKVGALVEEAVDFTFTEFDVIDKVED